MSTDLIHIEKFCSREFGAKKAGNEYIFTVEAHPERSLTLNLYTLNGKSHKTVNMLPYKLASDVYSVKLTSGDSISGFSYDYTCDGITFNDPYMTDHTVSRKYKEIADESNAERAVIRDDSYDFENDSQLKHAFEDVIAYQLHVRGFTKHASSKVKAKGTYRGITEKTDHFKSLNINQLIIMPSYEFYEYDSDMKVINRLNYWGFKEGFYFCPKAGYAYSDDFVTEFKDMVKTLHKAGIEIIMQFYFPASVNVRFISDCLGFWYTEYHVDGFYLMGERLPADIIFTDPLLYDAKLYAENINGCDDIFKSHKTCRYICDVNKQFLYNSRKFLKGDDDSLSGFVLSHSSAPKDIRRLNYITCYEGFTLNDLVSYNKKHNEENGENNSDGFFDNISWNCGVEGKSGRKLIKDIRLSQMKNAMCLMLLSKASPMLLMGDEFMNTQNGNNNPYCQDGPVTWLNWSLNKYNTQLLEFVKMLTRFRKMHPVLRKEISILTSGNGFPDISYHQDNAWQYKIEPYSHHIGIMENDEKNTIYIACNMHWENRIFGLPKLKKGYVWKYIFDTSGQASIEFKRSLKKDQDNICLYRRSIMVMQAVKEGKNA